MRSIVRTCLMVIALFTAYGCATTTTTWTSRPQSAKVSTPDVVVEFRPIKMDKPFFVGFELAVHNLSASPLVIDWNQTRYIHNQKSAGLFVFEGIEPEALKNRSLPNETIPAGGRMAKRISPARTIAWNKFSSNTQISQPAFEPGILPNGHNGASLFLIQKERQWRQPVAVEIVEARSPE